MKVEFSTKENMSDEDDDLESLRLAALQTIKKPAAGSIQPNLVNMYKSNSNYNISPQGKRTRNFQGGRQRNGQFNHRVRNTNLISIPTVPCEDDEKIKTPFNTSESSVPKLVLPQDRYCNSKVTETKSSEVTSKFTRYDNSDDDSESESEDDIGSDSPKKLERSDSLEALMQELENEIQGESKCGVVQEKKSKPKKTKRVAKSDAENEKGDEEMENAQTGDGALNKSVSPGKNDQIIQRIEQKENVNDSTDKYVAPRKTVPVKHFPKQTRQKNLSAKWKNAKPPVHSVQPNIFQPPYMHQVVPYQTFIDPGQMQYNISYQPSVPAPPPPLPELPVHTPRYDLPRPLSPLTLNAEVLSTVTMAPLSPRSAAFVLQNREIIERRKRSPRRSYSRSPTPFSSKSSNSSCRGSRSPVPHRTSPPKRASPLKDSSPRSNRKVPARNHTYTSSGKPETLKKDEGKTKNNRISRRSNSLSLSPSPVRTETKKSPENPKDAPVDPVLEARRKKFESKEIGKTEGVIRLKPKTEESPGQEDGNEINEDELLKDDESVIDLKVDDLFSDEDESEDENEGRFKVKSSEKSKTVPILPFTQLVSGAKNKVDSEPLVKERSRHREHRRERKRPRSRSPVEPPKKKTERDREKERERKASSLEKKPESTSDKSKNHGNRHKMPVSTPIECKKIEIKIRNPSKYNDEVKERSRKVDVKKPEDEPEPEIIIENEEEEEIENTINNKSAGGDLRAQLSRKRAERQSKFPATDGVPSRIIQNAFQGAVFKKVRKVKKETDAAPKDGKIPIHLRLGNSDIGADVKIRKKVSRKRKNQLEQV